MADKYVLAMVNPEGVTVGYMPKARSTWPHDPKNAMALTKEQADALIASNEVPCHPDHTLEARPAPEGIEDDTKNRHAGPITPTTPTLASPLTPTNVAVEDEEHAPAKAREKRKA